ncbi:F0F1 ATP synthase subunit B' [Aquisalinus flavus]|uniref:ATP synthase subunit b n=1 Tax=Aquisalinus flavus TaxID=1526572 RepID=A0A8J2Y5V7_9PROT|nr:F0F1 ATP synthase subunit B' [Aquisalinus flavus]MBD0426726.1 F0F1 ATP synthase subunit B' [Aquisalinus flavus]UNE46589.1 F0F1 ATP synthase subunit B' [Aquisalinus flavus]GGC95488.1 ATP synthase subunit b 2 [Aquisalinus flavus]
MTPILMIMAFAPGEAAESSGGLPQMDVSTYPSQLFWLALTFGILYWLMDRVFLPKLGGIIEERRNRIADDYDKAAEFKREAGEAEEAYRKALADARAKAASIAAETRASLDEEIAGMQADMDETLNQQIAAAEARIAQMQTAAEAKVREAAIETTKAVVQVLIDEQPDDAAVKNAIEAAQAS